MSTNSAHRVPPADIMVVEDNPSDLKYMSDVLTKAGHRVRLASDGELALRSVRAKLPDLILLDIKLPTITGVEVCRRLKANPETRDLPAIFISALGETDLKVKALEAGGADYVTKPFEPSEVLARINTHLKMYRLQQSMVAQTAEMNAEIEYRKKTQEKLRASEETLRLTLDVVSDGGWDWDTATGEVRYSDRWLESLGYKRDEVPPHISFRESIVHPDDLLHTKKELNAHLDGSTPTYECENRLRTASGEYRWNLDRGRVVARDGGGKALRMVGADTDITERKKAQEKLHQYAQIVSSATDMLALIDQRYVYLAANAAYLQAFAKAPDEVIGRTVAEVFGKEFFNTVIRARAERCLAGESIRYDAWFEFPATDPRYMDVIYSPYLGPDSGICGFVVTARDITERQQAGEERERLLHDMGERVKELRCLHGVADSISKHSALEDVFQNAAALLPPGWHYPEITRGRIHFDGKDYDSEPFERTRWSQTSDIIVGGERRGFVEVCYLEQRPDLDEGPFLSEERNLINSIAHALSEATERKSAEAELRKLSVAVEQSPASIVITDTQGTIEYVNPMFCDVTGYTAEEAIGQNPRILKSGKWPKKAYKVMWDTILAGKTWNGEFENKKKSGELYWEAASICPIRDVEGSITHFLAVKQDITERKRAERELKELHEELVRASRLAGMSEVATDVLHNVGNVLNSVNVSAGLVNEKVRGSRISGLAKAAALVSEHADDLGTFITQDERGKQLPVYLTKLAEHLADEQADVLGELRQLTENIEHIKNIVSMQQSLSGLSGVTEPVRIDDLLDDLLKMDASSLDHRGVKLVREYDELPVVTIEKHKLMQILMNLLKNAKDALTEDQRPDRRLTVRLRALDEGRVQIEVADNAVGIPPENLTRIFAHGFTTKKDGHGFGLHSSALAAMELGGSLAAHSDGLGRGATFTLELPLEVKEKSDVCSAI